MPALEFQQGNSLMHRLSPIGKFTWGGVIVAWLFLMFNPAYVFLLGVAILLIAKFAAGLSILKVLKTSALVGVAGISIMLFQTFLYQGGQHAIFQFGPLRPTYEGFSIGLAIALRVLGIVAASTVIAKTTSPEDIFLALVKLGAPYRIAFGLFTAIRFIPMLEYQAGVIMDAQYVRGITTKKGGFNLLNKFRSLLLFLIPLIVTGMRSAEESAKAMEVRAFGLYETRTYSRDLIIPKWEKFFVGAWVLALVVYLLIFQGNIMEVVFYNPPTVEPWEQQ